MLTDIVEELSKKPEEEKVILDQSFVQLAKNVKQLYGRPVEDPEVQKMIKTYMEVSFQFLGEELMQQLANTDMGELDIQELENMTPSPFTADEEKWLNLAMEYCMKQTDID